MVAEKSQAATPPETLDQLLKAAGEDNVLVGGQALGFWVLRYGICLPESVTVVTLDTDFLAKSASSRAAVESFAQAIGGRAVYPDHRALTALVGQAELSVSDDEYVNVDVIFQVIGLDADAVRKRAVRVSFGSGTFLVMHPLHVLRSRLYNLHELRDKQTEKGAMQLAIAIEVGREFLRACAADPEANLNGGSRSPIQPLISEIEKLALDDAGKKVARRWGQHVADAIDPSLIAAGPFWERKWPTLQGLMSAAYAKRFSPPGNPDATSIPRMRS